MPNDDLNDLLRRAHDAQVALAERDGRPAPPSPPLLTPGGLIAWADSPTTAPCPLPSLGARRTRGGYRLGWPVGLLPAEPLAIDLAARGLTYAPGLGYVIDGERGTAHRAARMVADVLDAAADLLPDPRLAALRTALADYDDAYLGLHDAAFAEEAAGTLPGEGSIDAREFARMTDWTFATRATTASAIEHASPEDHAEDTPEVAAEREALRQALRATADEIRVSAAARRAVLDLVREHLGEPPPLERSQEPVEAFLAAFDDRRKVRRSALWTAYRAAGSPGDRRKSDLFGAAALRWGDAVRADGGHFVFRPACAGQNPWPPRPSSRSSA